MINQRKKDLIIVVGVVLLVVIGWFAYSYFEKIKKAEKDYNNLLTSTAEMLYQYEQVAESHCKNMEKVWYNSIYEVSDDSYNEYVISDGKFNDFNTSIFNYYEKNIESIEDLQKGKDLIEDGMKLLRVMREKNNFDDNVYNSLINLYNSFSKIADMAIDPSGSYNQYSSQLPQYINEFQEQYRAVKISLPNDNFNTLGK